MPTLLLDDKTIVKVSISYPTNIISKIYIIPKQNSNAGGVFCLIYLDKVILKFIQMNKQVKQVEESFKMKSDEQMLDLTFLTLKL